MFLVTWQTKSMSKKNAILSLDPGTCGYELLVGLCYTGEMPTRCKQDFPLFTEETIVRTIKRLKDQGYVRIEGKGKLKTIRPELKAKKWYKSQCPWAYEMILRESSGFKYGSLDAPGLPKAVLVDAQASVRRRHRKFHMVRLLLECGVLCGPDRPEPHGRYDMAGYDFDRPAYYSKHEIARTLHVEVNKISYARIAGVVFSPGQAMACHVFAPASTTKKTCFATQGEQKASVVFRPFVETMLADYGRYRRFDFNHTLLFGDAPLDCVLLEMEAAAQSLQSTNSFMVLYEGVHYIGADDCSRSVLRSLLLPEGRKQIVHAVFGSQGDPLMTKGCEFERSGNSYIQLCDGDLSKLLRFAAMPRKAKERRVVVAYASQVEQMKEWALRHDIILRPVDQHKLLERLFGTGVDHVQP